MHTFPHKESRIIHHFAVALAVIVALSIPVGYWAVLHQGQTSSLQTEVDISAEIITEFISKNPDLWLYLEERLADLLVRRESLVKYKESQHIIANNGEIIAEDALQLISPTISRKANIYDSGKVVGYLLIERSVSFLIFNTIIALLLGVGFGALIFFLVRISLGQLNKALNKIAEQRRRLFITLESLNDGIISTDQNGKINFVNKRAEQITGYLGQDLVNTNFNQFIAQLIKNPKEERKELVGRALWQESNPNIFTDIETRTKENTNKNLNITMAPIFGEKDRVKHGIVFVLKDITDDKNLERELHKVEQIQTLGVFAGGIAHDFNNILTTISNNISRIYFNTDLSLDDRTYTSLERVQEAVAQANEISSQLLTFAQGGDPLVKSISIGEEIKKTIDFVLHGSNIGISLDIPEDLWTTLADPGQISQVVQNLIINASQAMEGKQGTITVTCRNIDEHSESSDPKTAANNKYVEVSVRDDGAGIPEKIKSSIFDPYFTTKPDGSGLGLAACYSIINKHGGTLNFESEEGHGTTFFFRVPANPEFQVESKTKDLTPVKGTGRVLVMDDDIPLLESVANNLEDLGYTVKTAQDGQEAINYYIQAKENGEKFDLAILDITVPGKMGGKEAYEKLQEYDPAAKAIVTSGYSNDPIMAHYLNAGFCGILKKPYQLHELSKVVYEAINAEDAPTENATNKRDILTEGITTEQGTSDNAPAASDSQDLNDLSDVATLQKRLEDQTYYSAKAEVSSVAMHNIRNALTPIFLNLQELKKSITQIDHSSCEKVQNELSSQGISEERKELLTNYLLLSYKNFGNILKELLTVVNSFSGNVSRIGEMVSLQDEILLNSNIVESFEVEDLVNDALRLFPKETFESINIHLAPSLNTLGTVRSQKVTLTQVFHKIIKNAAESITQNGVETGRIFISAKKEVESGIEFIHAQVKDNGEGIKAEIINKIFEPDFSTKTEHGRGKGLHFCITCISALGGKIFAESAGSGQGATIHILFKNVRR